MKFGIGFLFGLIVISCASVLPGLKLSEKTFHPCDKGVGTTGEWCYRACSHVHWLTRKCSQWTIEKKNTCDTATFEELRSANMRMISEDRLKTSI